MNYEQIHSLFKQRYNQSSWKQFLTEAFVKTRLLASPEILTGIDANVASQVQKLGFITLDENGIERQIAVYEVTLAEGIILERNRVGLRNLLRKYWKDIDAAFIVYHRPGVSNWRFTYVSELTGFNAEGDFVKIKTEPKRYTYVLGEGESTRTAAERFTTIANKGSKATLDDVKEAFSVEKLSKAFFDEYKKHYDIFCDFMVSKPNIRQTIFNGDEKGIRDFNKKFLGRIVFLYFIQKKGWLGVPLKEDWGNGDFNFLTKQYENFRNKDLFYKDFLSILFFETLNTKRKDDIFNFDNAQFILKNTSLVKIPFLSGGLFDEDDKKQRGIIFPANLIKSLFDFFNQYNFTIYEDSPNDHTVAVDPEMLGHIFENLLEDNKDKGAFYTPKEIVHYMCQESLIEYLCTSLEIENENKEKEAITLLLKKKELDPILKPEIKNLNKALDIVKICDPAIGSGAFPMGLLHEIFTAKQTLHTFEHGNTKTFDASAVKLNIIQNSIYGVDIEKGAVDIARLRFWLSLIVDENKPQALPNLDYKIVVGNSLVSKLGDDIIDIDWTLNETSHGLFGADLAKQKGELLKKISKEQKEFFKPNSDKKKLAAEIRNSKIDLLITQLELIVKTQGIETKPTGTSRALVKQTEIYLQTISWKNSIKDLQKLKTKPEAPLQFFDWKLDFPEVMNEQVAEKLGFDIVIANPPYIDSETMVNTGNEDLRIFLSNKLHFCKGNWDIYIAFFDFSFSLLNKTGNLVFITPDKWISKPFGDEIRKGLKDNFNSIAEAGRKVFENAKVDSIITFITKTPKSNIRIDKFLNGEAINFSLVDKTSLIEPFAFDWLFSDFVEKINSIDKFPNKLSEYAFCENACATSDAYKIKDYIIDTTFDSEKHLKIINTGTIGRFVSKWGKREMTYLKDKYLEPVVNKRKFQKDFSNSYGAKSILPKLIIKGLTLLDGCFDKDGVIIPGKSTLVITKPQGKENELLFPLALINSKISLFYIKEKYRGSSYNQGINFNPDMLNNLPVPYISKGTMKTIISTVLKIIKEQELENDTLLLEENLNKLFYKLYELTFDEVKVIDPEFSLSKKEYEAIKLD
jgi:adenine-specific DNA-methyltransferase